MLIAAELMFSSPYGVWVVSVNNPPVKNPYGRFHPLTGCGLFLLKYMRDFGSITQFPSPCGVWVVSAKLHILFGATGKRIVNFAVLLYHIGRWFINSKLRNYKVPCEAHKTET